MKRTYTRAGLLAEWRLRRHLEPLRGDVDIEFDGAGMNPLYEAEMDGWWGRVVDTAPAEWLHPEELKAFAAAAVTPSGEAVEVTLPESKRVRRLLRVRLEGWESDAVIAAPGSWHAMRQLNSFSRSGTAVPVAVMESGCRLLLYPAVGTAIESLLAVTDGDRTAYTFDDRAFGIE